ncbi:hypothetical protein MNB_SV-12-96 [hydrothermal vent metagenome]|uniref:Calcineurin-like phosphoesterase domain-containing protein n=1 Tax=hydrothermal vent metagenome TaxID=652676 RepID=A0A1W1BAI2_9ZZZZ
MLSKSVIYIKYKILKIDRDRKEKRDINIPQKQNSYHRILKPLAQKLLKYSFREYMVSIAKENSCSVVICGHFHIPEDKIIKGIRYLNCGDWIENSSFIVEDMNGNFFLKR